MSIDYKTLLYYNSMNAERFTYEQKNAAAYSSCIFYLEITEKFQFKSFDQPITVPAGTGSVSIRLRSFFWIARASRVVTPSFP